MGAKYTNEDRGISNIVGVILLVAISITAALLILSAGQSTIEDTRNDQNAEVTVDTFQQADTLFRSFPREVNNTGSRSIEVPESIQENLESSEETTYRIRLNDNPDCDTGQRQLGSLRYQSDNGKLIGYQGGGVWELNSESSSMRSPPGISYTEGSLNVQFRSIDGNLTNSERITVESNKSLERARQNTLMTALYTNLSYDEVASAPDQHIVCEPSSVWRATVFINESDFASAWARYARENYDSSSVQVSPASSVSAGENISITFALGDVSKPEVVVEDIETSRHSASDPLWVNATVINRGGLETTQTIEFSFGNDSETISTASQDVTLVGGRQKRLNFNVSSATLQSSISPGQYNATVETDSESANETVHFGSAPYVPDFEITSVSAPADAAVDAEREVEVTVNNTGGLSDRHTVGFYFDGNRVNETALSLEPGENQTVNFTVPTEMDGRHNWNISTGDDSTNGTIVVGTDARYMIESLTPPSSDTAGNTFELEATIANEGQRNGTRPVYFRIKNDTNGNVVTNKTFMLSLNGTVVGSTDTTTESIAPTITTPGTYNYTVSTGGAVQTGSFTVGSQSKPNFIVQSLTFSENPTTFGKHIWFNMTIRNTGDAAGTQTVNLSSNGSLWESQRTLISGESETITKNRSITSANFSAGDNTVEVRTANASLSKTLNVSAVNPGDSVDQDGNQLTTTVGVNASIELLGAELEGEFTEDCSPDDEPCPAGYSEWGYGLTYERRAIINDPTEMALEVDNDTGDYRIPLWQGKYGGDLNHPKAEFDLINGPNPYNETFTFGPNVSFGVYATSYNCGDYDHTTVVWRDLVSTSSGLRDAIGKKCTDRDGVNIPIDSSDNPSNVVILKDGESIPGPTNTFQADFYQRNVQEILGSRLHSNKTLDLAPGERVMMYELSEENAYPNQANWRDGVDYNDAVVLFRTISQQRTVLTGPEFEITDFQAPGQVTQGNPAEVQITVNNTGDTPGEPSVKFDFEGSAVVNKSAGTDIDPNNETTFGFSVPTGSTGTFDYTASVVDEPYESRSGQIRVGSGPEPPYFQVLNFSAPDSTTTGGSVNVSATIKNTGNTTGSQTIKLRAAGRTNRVITTSETISDGAETRVEFELDTPNNETIAYQISTVNMTTGQQYLYVNESHVIVNSTEVGVVSYDENELIERREIDEMMIGVENRGGLGGSRTVNLMIENKSTGNAETHSVSVSLGDGQISPPYPGYVSFDMTDLNVTEGYYDYTVTVENEGSVEDRWTGEIFVHERVSVEESSETSSPITVDSSQVRVSD